MLEPAIHRYSHCGFGAKSMVVRPQVPLGIHPSMCCSLAVLAVSGLAQPDMLEWGCKPCWKILDSGSKMLKCQFALSSGCWIQIVLMGWADHAPATTEHLYCQGTMMSLLESCRNAGAPLYLPLPCALQGCSPCMSLAAGTFPQVQVSLSCPLCESCPPHGQPLG